MPGSQGQWEGNRAASDVEREECGGLGVCGSGLSLHSQVTLDRVPAWTRLAVLPQRRSCVGASTPHRCGTGCHATLVCTAFPGRSPPWARCALMSRSPGGRRRARLVGSRTGKLRSADWVARQGVLLLLPGQLLRDSLLFSSFKTSPLGDSQLTEGQQHVNRCGSRCRFPTSGGQVRAACQMVSDDSGETHPGVRVRGEGEARPAC